MATVSGDLAAATDNWRTKSIVGESAYSHNEKSGHDDANRRAADSRKGNAGSEARRGGFREDTDRESGHRAANTTVERAESVVNVLEVQSNTVSVQEDTGNKVDMPAVHHSVAGRSATQASPAAWKNNDMEVCRIVGPSVPPEFCTVIEAKACSRVGQCQCGYSASISLWAALLALEKGGRWKSRTVG